MFGFSQRNLYNVVSCSAEQPPTAERRGVKKKDTKKSAFHLEFEADFCIM